ncbi:D-alanyl-D-alanine carboxypeptidase [Brucella pituitosa]|uniref:D-alanyl-D-alanine carboxypeptidase n=1 Tax=Brucella pituitosa TaxID=571256 RepID=UPI0009A22A29|nr:D-alanyl-D-alanine carboxypeptidase [Brucella pituitosa]
MPTSAQTPALNYSFTPDDDIIIVTHRNALLAAGEPSIIEGTLKDRMVNSSTAGRTYANTGTRTGVSALLGYIDRASTHSPIFSIKNNDYSVPSKNTNTAEAKS